MLTERQKNVKTQRDKKLASFTKLVAKDEKTNI